jgi:hypothetical protein
MQDPPPAPTEDDEASVPAAQHMRDSQHLSAFSRKVSKRTLPWDLPAIEIQLALPQLQEEDKEIRKTKRPRLEEPFSASTDEYTTTHTPHGTLVTTPTSSATATDQADSDSVMDMHLDTKTTRVPRHWTTKDDEKLTSAFTNTRKKKRGKNYITNWGAIAALVPGRTKVQCRKRWYDLSVFTIDPATARKGKWKAEIHKKGPLTSTEDDEASVPTQHLRNGPILSAGSRKAAKRTFPSDLTVEDIQLALPPLQDEDIQEKKRPRLEKPSFASTDEGTTKNTSAHVTTVALLPQDAAADHHADSEPMMDMPRAWTPEEDEKLTSAVANTRKKKRGKKFITNWEAIAALVPDRTKVQCRKRWHDPSISQAMTRAGHWTVDEDQMLKDALPTHGVKNWVAIAALVSGRTSKQCYNRWRDALVFNIDPAAARAGEWTEDEDNKLENAVRAHGGKNWEAIAALISGRTKIQCCTRWHDALVSKIDPATARTGKWSAFEDKKLRNAVRAHAGKNWEAIATLVSGRTKAQCGKRWTDTLGCKIDPATARTGKWTAYEDEQLDNAVRTHGGKNWKAIAALVSGRTKGQCCTRWTDTLGCKIDPATARTGKWTALEDRKLKNAVLKHGGKNWKAIAALVPGRRTKECNNRYKRWHIGGTCGSV